MFRPSPASHGVSAGLKTHRSLQDGSRFQTFSPPAQGPDGAEKDRGSVAVVSKPWLNRREAVLGPATDAVGAPAEDGTTI
jgi:hypothetical protein